MSAVPSMQRPGLKKLENFLYKESELLAANDLESWMQLYAEDGIYWMPVKHDQEDGLNHVSIFYDDKVLMEIRMRHMQHPQAPSKDFQPRASHIIGNVQVQSFSENECVVTSNFNCVASYQSMQQIFAGRNTHTLIKQGDKWLIKLRRVDLINCDDSHHSIHSYI